MGWAGGGPGEGVDAGEVGAEGAEVFERVGAGGGGGDGVDVDC